MATIPLHLAVNWVDKVHLDIRKAAMDAAMDAVRFGAREVQISIIPKITPHPPVNRGTYKAGWMWEALQDGARLFNRVYPQAPLIEFGVRAENVKPGKAMRTAIAEWLVMKGIGPSGADDTIESIAWAICKSMKRRGIFNHAGAQGYHIIDKAIPVMLKEFNLAFVRRMKKQVGAK